MNKNAIALRAINCGGKRYRKGAKISLPDNQFADWAAVGLVREAEPKPEPKAAKPK